MKSMRLPILVGLLAALNWLTLPALCFANDDEKDHKSEVQAKSNRDQQDDDETQYRGMEHAAMGVMLSERTGKGVRISDILRGSPAEEAGLRAGDRLVKIDNKQISSYGDVIRFVNRIEPGQTAKITVARNGEQKALQITFASREQMFGDREEEFSRNAQRRPARSGQIFGQYDRDDQYRQPNDRRAQRGRNDSSRRQFQTGQYDQQRNWSRGSTADL